MAAAERARARPQRIVFWALREPKTHMNITAVTSARMVHAVESRDWQRRCQRCERAQMNVYQRVNSSIHPMTSPAVPKMTPSAMRAISFRVGSRASWAFKKSAYPRSQRSRRGLGRLYTDPPVRIDPAITMDPLGSALVTHLHYRTCSTARLPAGHGRSSRGRYSRSRCTPSDL
jgi:hypothetical protein